MRASACEFVSVGGPYPHPGVRVAGFGPPGALVVPLASELLIEAKDFMNLPPLRESVAQDARNVVDHFWLHNGRREDEDWHDMWDRWKRDRLMMVYAPGDSRG